MSAGFRGEARVRRVRRVECGGERECVWRLCVENQFMDRFDNVRCWAYLGPLRKEGIHTRGHRWGDRVWSRQAIWLGCSRRLRLGAGQFGAWS